MLHRKQAEQDKVDEKRLGHGSIRARVNGLRYHHIADESDGIQKGNEENQITNQAEVSLLGYEKKGEFLEGWGDFSR